jgi:hypothetical protein
MCSTIGRIFGLFAPFVSQLAIYWKPLPMLILGIPSILAAFSVYMLPETKHTKLPGTMKDANEIKQEKRNEIVF